GVAGAAGPVLEDGAGRAAVGVCPPFSAAAADGAAAGEVCTAGSASMARSGVCAGSAAWTMRTASSAPAMTANFFMDPRWSPVRRLALLRNLHLLVLHRSRQRRRLPLRHPCRIDQAPGQQAAVVRECR